MRFIRPVSVLILVLLSALQLAPVSGVYATASEGSGEVGREPRFVAGQTRELARAEQEDEPNGAHSNQRPPVRPVTVQRGGQTFNTVTYETETGPDGREIGAGAVLVKFKASANQAGRSDAHRAAGALTVDALGLADTARIQVRQGTVGNALAAYRARSDVAYAEPDYIVRRSFAPNDPFLGQQWGLARIGAQQAWDRTRSGADIRIAILDCGIFSSSSMFGSGHPDVRNKVVAEVNLTTSPFGADDFCNHGTHVAGIAAASTNNGVGIAGVGFDASILNAKVLDDTGNGLTSAVVQGIIWAADNGARVINMSLGGAGACSQTEQAAIDYAWSRNVVIVAAAGNENTPASSSPANCANVVSVAATDQSDARASFSNYGDGVDIAAPGVDILSTDWVGGYAVFDGTSQAAPHVAGLAALVWATEYGTSNQAVVNRILSTADHVPGTGSWWTHGRINAAAAVPPPVSCNPRPKVTVATALGGGRMTVTLTANGAYNTIRSVRFGADGRPPINARVDIPGGPSAQTGGFTYTRSTPSASFTFELRRQTGGQPTTLPLVVTDACGAWPTFVGGGAGAGF